MSDRTNSRQWVRSCSFVGVATTEFMESITSNPAYDFNYTGGTPLFTQRHTWKNYDDPGTPTARAIRADEAGLFYWWITVIPKGTTWQNNLDRVQIGSAYFVRPNHLHCWTTPPTPPSTTLVDDGLGEILLTIKYPNGDPVPFAILEEYNTAVLTARRIADANGVVLARAGFSLSQPQRGTDPTGDFTGVRQSVASTVITVAGPKARSVSTQGIKQKYWPRTVFQASGSQRIPKNKNWCPPIAIIKDSGTAAIEADCFLFMIKGDNDGRIGTTDLSKYVQQIGSVLEGSTDPLAMFLSRSHLTATEPGLYRRKTGYPATYFPSSQRWEACPGSDVTGYTPPAEEPSCPFVVKKGTL